MHPVVLGLLFAALLPGVAWAQGDIGRTLRAGDWPTAQTLAAGSADPVAGKLVRFLRLLHPGAAGAGEIADFLVQNPGWPGQAALLARRDEALSNEADDATARALCVAAAPVPPPRSGPALARCADAAAASGVPDLAAADARGAWLAGFADADAENRFLERWGGVLTPADRMRRFATLLGTDASAAAALLPRLAPEDRKQARARLALHGNAADAEALLAALPASARASPEMVLERARWLRDSDRDTEALALWTAEGFASERAAGGTAPFWAERGRLARKRLTTGDRLGAYALADDEVVTDPDAAADAAFLAGFIALRQLGRGDLAAARFARLAHTTSAISQARAHYWLGRVAEAEHDPARTRSEYQAAAAWPTTYYGQLAALALGEDAAALNARIAALADPGWTSDQALAFAGSEQARAATTLVAWGDPGRARAFLQQIALTAADPVTRSLDARFALDLGLPEAAVAAARRAGRDGTVLAQAGWPLAAQPPEERVPAALALGIIRQESSFEVGAVSPSGARGLMQLMPPTAAEVARQIGKTVPVAALTTDGAANMRLGTAYLGDLIERFGGSLPLAIAAYNAGPNRVGEWLAANGDPRATGRAAMIDWIERIGFSETRNYVQRVIENIAVYRAKRHEPAVYPVAP